MNNTLYRFFAGDGRLLYIGQTTAISKRLNQHAGDHSWWRAVTTITLEHYETRALVKEAEIRAIYREQPYFNIEHNEENPDRCEWSIAFNEETRVWHFPKLRTTLDDE